MAIRLHRCPLGFIKTNGHGCWQTQKVPVIEFEDGTAIREEGKVFAEMIRSGRLFEGHPGGPGAA